MRMGNFTIYYLLITIDYFSVASVPLWLLVLFEKTKPIYGIVKSMQC